MIKWHLRKLVITLGLLMPVIGNAKDITLTSVNWEPYAGAHLPNKGFTSEIIAKALERAGHRAVFSFLPWKRAMRSVAEGRIDALYSAYYSKERANQYAITDNYGESALVFAALADSDIQFSQLADLSPYRIGTVRGYVNTPKFDQADYLHKEPVVSDALNVKKLVKRRVDLIVIDKFVAIQQVKTNPTIAAQVRDIKFLTPVLESKGLHVMFSKKIEGYEQLVSDFNRGLAAIKNDGTYNDILYKFGITPDV